MPSGFQPRSDLWSLRCQGDGWLSLQGCPGTYACRGSAPVRSLLGLSGGVMPPLLCPLLRCLFRPASASLRLAQAAPSPRGRSERQVEFATVRKRRSTLNRLAKAKCDRRRCGTGGPRRQSSANPRSKWRPLRRCRLPLWKTASPAHEIAPPPDNTLSGAAVSVAFSTRHLLIRHYIRATRRSHICLARPALLPDRKRGWSWPTRNTFPFAAPANTI